MPDKFNKLLDDYDLIVDKIRRVSEEFLAYHSTNMQVTRSDIASVLQGRLKKALEALTIV